MAVFHGTVTGAENFYNLLIDKLTNDPDLAAIGQNWDVVWQGPGSGQYGNEILLKGPGLAGQDEIYVGMSLFQDPIPDNYWMNFVGATGPSLSTDRYFGHINATPSRPRMFLDGGPMEYWIVANGQRFICIVRISTVYEACYCGFILPFAMPTQYPYPLFIGGSAGDAASQFWSSIYTTPMNWRSEADNHQHFLSSWAQTGQSMPPSAWLLAPENSWVTVANRGNSGPVRLWPQNTNGDYHEAQTSNSSYQADFIRSRLQDAFGGQKVLLPSILTRDDPGDATYGVLQGVYRCQGYINQAENIIEANDIDHLVIQNTFRSNIGEFWALALD